MEIKPGFLDGLTSIDELLKENTHTLRELRSLLEREEDKATKIIYFAYPSDGTLATLQAGTTTFDFGAGTIEDVNHAFTKMNRSLKSEGRDWLRSFFVNSDKLITIQADSYDRIPAGREKDALGTYQQFTKIKITCVEETKVFVICSTAPDSIIKLISNAVAIRSPADVFGNENIIGFDELAARLGSPSIFEKRGNLLFTDVFESSLAKYVTHASGDGSVKRSITTSHTGNYSLKMTLGTGTNEDCGMWYLLQAPAVGCIGFETTFALGANVRYVWFQLNLYTGTHRYQGQLLYEPGATELSVYIDGSAYQVIDNAFSLYENDNVFHTMKLVWNIDTKKYVRAYADNKKYDISAYDVDEGIDTVSKKHLLPKILITDQPVGAHYAYIDNIIVTRNEPLI